MSLPHSQTDAASSGGGIARNRSYCKRMTTIFDNLLPPVSEDDLRAKIAAAHRACDYAQLDVHAAQDRLDECNAELTHLEAQLRKMRGS
jgi:hypothetical protein